jgi:hypothetical protein
LGKNEISAVTKEGSHASLIESNTMLSDERRIEKIEGVAPGERDEWRTASAFASGLAVVGAFMHCLAQADTFSSHKKDG